MPGQLRNVLRRITSGAVSGAEITASFSGAVQRVITDADGYFRVHLHLTPRRAAARLGITLTL